MKTSSRLIISSFVVAIVSALAVPDLRYGIFSIVIFFFLTPLAISVLLVGAWLARGSSVALWQIIASALTAFALHSLISFLLYARWVGSFHFDPETNGLLTMALLMKAFIFLVVLGLGWVYIRLSMRGHTRAL